MPQQMRSALIGKLMMAGAAAVAVLLAGTANAGPQAVRDRTITLDAQHLAQAKIGDAFAIELFDDVAVSGMIARRHERAAGCFTTSGMLTSDLGGTFVVAVNQGAVAGVIRAGNRGLFQLRGRAPEITIEQVVSDDLPCFTPDHPPIDPHVEGTARTGAPCDDGSVIDVLVVFTPAAANSIGGMNEMLATIDMMVEESNLAYDMSEVATQLNLVYAAWLNVNGEPSLEDLVNPNDGVIDGVHALRDSYGADLVALIFSGGGGVAHGLSSLTDPEDEAAFSRSGLLSMPAAVLTHEIGHNLGCCHAWFDGGGCSFEGGLLFSYSNGYRWFGDSGTQWRTVMAYSPGTTLVRFSNPRLTFDGQLTGVPQGQQFEADNADTINQSAFVVANRRCSNPTCQDLDLPPFTFDCNANGVPDACDIAIGTSPDVSKDGIPDECCPTDITGIEGIVDGDTSVLDLLAIINAWGPCTGCPQDINGNGLVNLADIIHLVNNWGPCSPL